MTTATVSRGVHCRTENTLTAWKLASRENGRHPVVLHWRCRTCPQTRYQLGVSVTDGEGLILYVGEEWRRGHNHDRLDWDDIYGELRATLWSAWITYNPSLDGGGGSFKGYAVWKLRNSIVTWIRKNVGYAEGREKPHAVAVGYDHTVHDDAGLGHAVGRGPVDDPADRVASLERVLAARRHGIDGVERRLREETSRQTARRSTGTP